MSQKTCPEKVSVVYVTLWGGKDNAEPQGWCVILNHHVIAWLNAQTGPGNVCLPDGMPVCNELAYRLAAALGVSVQEEDIDVSCGWTWKEVFANLNTKV